MKLTVFILQYTTQDGDVSSEEFIKAVQKTCVGKPFDEFPPGFKVFITNQYNSVDCDGK